MVSALVKLDMRPLSTCNYFIKGHERIKMSSLIILHFTKQQKLIHLLRKKKKKVFSFSRFSR